MKKLIEKPLYHQPSLREAKVRGKEKTQVVQFETLSDAMKTIGLGKKYHIQTYGCQMNMHDSETMAGILETMAYTVCADE